jgi:primosomal protein N'
MKRRTVWECQGCGYETVDDHPHRCPKCSNFIFKEIGARIEFVKTIQPSSTPVIASHMHKQEPFTLR